MEQNGLTQTFKTSLAANIWAERNHILIFLMAVIVAIIAQFTLLQFFELLIGLFLWTGIFFLGFVGIAAHIQYYFHLERSVDVKLYTDRMVIYKHGDVLAEIFKRDIVKIVICDRLRNYGYESDGYDHYYNAWSTFADPFYYLLVIDKQQGSIILTCLLDIRLKKKIAAWYGQKLEHKYQFFPFP
jgi:hypothetical protein